MLVEEGELAACGSVMNTSSERCPIWGAGRDWRQEAVDKEAVSKMLVRVFVSEFPHYN
jgi:hypothetical protein